MDIPAWIDGQLRPCDKIEVHRRGLRHPAVSVFVVEGDSLLIQRRALSKYHTPGLWANTCCTHPYWGEDAGHCAARRLEDELGIRMLTLEPRGQIEYRADVGNGMIEHEVVTLFLGRVSGGIDIQPNPDEVMETRWISWDALAREITEDPGKFTPWLRIYLAEHSAILRN